MGPTYLVLVRGEAADGEVDVLELYRGKDEAKARAIYDAVVERRTGKIHRGEALLVTVRAEARLSTACDHRETDLDGNCRAEGCNHRGSSREIHGPT